MAFFKASTLVLFQCVSALKSIPGANKLGAVIYQASSEDPNGDLRITCISQCLQCLQCGRSKQSGAIPKSLHCSLELIMAWRGPLRLTKSWKMTFKAPRIFTGAISER